MASDSKSDDSLTSEGYWERDAGRRYGHSLIRVEPTRRRPAGRGVGRRLAYPRFIDVLLHEPARLRVLALLAMVEEADFMYLLRKTGLSRGNLSVQMGRLETAGLVHLEKELVDGRPRTRYCLTEKGRESLREYKRTMLGLLAQFPD